MQFSGNGAKHGGRPRKYLIYALSTPNPGWINISVCMRVISLFPTYIGSSDGTLRMHHAWTAMLLMHIRQRQGVKGHVRFSSEPDTLHPAVGIPGRCPSAWFIVLLGLWPQ